MIMRIATELQRQQCDPATTQPPPSPMLVKCMEWATGDVEQQTNEIAAQFVIHQIGRK